MMQVQLEWWQHQQGNWRAGRRERRHPRRCIGQNFSRERRGCQSGKGGTRCRERWLHEYRIRKAFCCERSARVSLATRRARAAALPFVLWRGRHAGTRRRRVARCRTAGVPRSDRNSGVQGAGVVGRLPADRQARRCGWLGIQCLQGEPGGRAALPAAVGTRVPAGTLLFC